MGRQSRSFSPHLPVSLSPYLPLFLSPHLPTACCLLPSAFSLLIRAERDRITTTLSFANALPFSFTTAAAEPSSVGRGDVVSWAAVGSHTCNRADGIRCHVVC